MFNKNLIGVDIGTYSLKVVKLKGSRGSYSLDGAISVKMNKDSAGDATYLSGVIAEAVRSLKVSGMAATAVPPSSLILRQLSLPSMPDKDLKEAVKWEIRKEVAFPPNELIADYSLSGTSSKTAENMLSLVAFGVKRGEVERLISIFKNARLELRVADAAPMALLTAFDANNAWEPGVNYAMLDMGETRSMLVIFKDSRLAFVREIGYGGNDLTLALAEGLHKDPLEAELYKLSADARNDETVKGLINGSVEGLVAELQRSFDYYHAQFREGAVSKLFLSGGMARIGGLDDFIKTSIGISTFVHDPLRNIKIPKGLDNPALRDIAPCLSVAIGLAARTLN